MSTPIRSELEFEKRLASRLLDTLIRAGLIAALVVLCYRIFAPFLTLMVWALILAVTLYPMHQMLARKLKGRQGLAATLLVIGGGLLIVAPSALLINSLGDSVHYVIDGVRNDTLQIPPPSESVKSWPAVGEKVHELWFKAHTDLPGFVQSMQPKIGDITKGALALVASLGVQILVFLASFLVAGILLAFNEAGGRSGRAIFDRVIGSSRGERFVMLSVATIRAVALGVIGVAFIQAVCLGVALLIAGVPLAGVLAVITLVLAIVQIPVMIVTLPVIGYLWLGGDYSTGAASVYTVLLLIVGVLDNVLKPFMMGRGVDAPMPVILFGALGGMATAGIHGMFVGAVVLAIGYQMFMSWVANDPDTDPTIPPPASPPV